MNAQPRLVVSAPSSGHGKTAIAVGLLAAAVARGVPAAGFKVGPDHTDAAYLGLAAGRPGRNLDPRLVGAQRIAPLFGHGAAGAHFSVIEGAMGLFDSLTGQPEIDGTAAVAAALRAPVVLVVDVAAMGHSIAALVHGFRMFDEMVHLGGVILNRIASPRHEQMLRTALDDIGMPVLGALGRGDLPNVLPARSHGPVPVAHRTVEASRAVRRLGEAVLAGLDLDRLMALANSAPALPGPLWTPADALAAEPFDQHPVIALAGGPGAPYTYVETAELLTAAGADVAVVDPLRDETLPAGTRALVVGAGLPEGYAEELSANRRLCTTVAKFAADGWPVLAEGVALPWLAAEFDGRPMCGVLDATAYTGEQTVAGYREATAPATSVLAPTGARITGYKQHRAVLTPRAGSVPAWTWSGGTPEGFVWRQVHASQLGIHWAAAPEIAQRVVTAAIAGPVSASPAGPAQPADRRGADFGPSSGDFRTPSDYQSPEVHVPAAAAARDDYGPVPSRDDYASAGPRPVGSYPDSGDDPVTSEFTAPVEPGEFGPRSAEYQQVASGRPGPASPGPDSVPGYGFGPGGSVPPRPSSAPAPEWIDADLEPVRGQMPPPGSGGPRAMVGSVPPVGPRPGGMTPGGLGAALTDLGVPGLGGPVPGGREPGPAMPPPGRPANGSGPNVPGQAGGPPAGREPHPAVPGGREPRGGGADDPRANGSA